MIYESLYRVLTISMCSSLNPYSNGIWSTRNNLNQNNMKVDRLNPYSNGIWCTRGRLFSRCSPEESLNPYSNGIWSTSILDAFKAAAAAES